MAKAPRKGFLYAGAAALLLALLFRKDVAKSAAVVGKTVTDVLDAKLQALLKAVESLPVTPTKAYNLLPPGPPEIGPLGVNKALDGLESGFRAKIERFEADDALNKLLMPFGITARRGETVRTWARQVFLYGIGRAYQAPGRSGTVTDAVFATGNHPKGKAVDYNYYKNGKYMGDATEVKNILLPHAARIRSTYGIAWGGLWKKPDVPHFEDA